MLLVFNHYTIKLLTDSNQMIDQSVLNFLKALWLHKLNILKVSNLFFILWVKDEITFSKIVTYVKQNKTKKNPKILSSLIF